MNVDDLKKLTEKNIDFRVIITGNDHGYKEMIKEMLRLNIPVRYLPIDNFSIIINDSKECKISFKNLELPERMNLKINDPDLSSFLNQYFLSLWKKAKDIRKIIPDLGI